jgi:hypothetical protein
MSYEATKRSIILTRKMDCDQMAMDLLNVHPDNYATKY